MGQVGLLRIGQENMRKLFASTGTMVARVNNYNYPRALREIRSLYDDGLCDGLELMMLVHYYDKADAVIGEVRASCVPAEVIHCEKEIGTMLSDAGKLQADGDRDGAERLSSDALELFRRNCMFAERLMIPRMVLHLWGGFASDTNIEYNISKLGELEAIAKRHGTRLLIENIPSQKSDPLTNWHALLPHLGESGFIFDTRFGCLHAQSADILTDGALTPLIEHVHISDFGGGYREFKALRPILHPGEGNVDFDEIARLLDAFGYSGTITLESPVCIGEELDIPKLRRTLAYLREKLC